MNKIVTEGSKVLRGVASEVDVAEINTKSIQNVIANMITALESEKHGVAIAAPQINESLRIFVVAGFVFARMEHAQDEEGIDMSKYPAQVYINPRITKVSKKQVTGDEGCLSVPGKYSWSVPRADKVTIEYLDEKGEKHIRGASGFLARIFQHEIDHLEGVLYTDKAKELHDVDEDFNKIEQ